MTEPEKSLPQLLLCVACGKPIAKGNYVAIASIAVSVLARRARAFRSSMLKQPTDVDGVCHALRVEGHTHKD